MNSIAFRARRVPALLRALVMVPVVAASAYFLMTQSGPYAWVADLQMRTLGAYYPVLSGLVVVAACLLPAAVLIQVLATFWPTAAPDPTPEQQQAISAREEEKVRRYVWPVVFLVAAAGALTIAAVQLGRAATLGDNVAYALAADAWPPESRWVTLSASARIGEGITFENENTQIVTHYIPLCAPFTGSDKDGAVEQFCPLVAVVLDSALARFRSARSWSGTIDGPVSGVIGLELTEAGASLTNDARNFHFENDPDELREMGVIAGFVGVVAGAIGAIWLLVLRRRRGRVSG